MSKGILVFEKKFPKMSLEDYDTLVDNCSSTVAPFQQPNSKARYQKIIEESVQFLIPGRDKAKLIFIEQAKKIADLYTIDTVVMEYVDRLTVSFSVDCNDIYTELHRIIELSDSISFRQDTDSMYLLLTFYTRATYLNGRQITPERVLETFDM